MTSSQIKMIIYILRHGFADHLLENYNRKVNFDEFCTLLDEWIEVHLTNEGKDDVINKGLVLKGTFRHIYYSPLRRTKQTAKAICHDGCDVITSIAIEELEEIYILPPKLNNKWKIKIKYWITLCVAKSIFSLKVFSYIKTARKIMRRVEENKEDSLVISHQARILTILVYCFFSRKWKINKIDVNPAGVSVVEKK